MTVGVVELGLSETAEPPPRSEWQHRGKNYMIKEILLQKSHFSQKTK